MVGFSETERSILQDRGETGIGEDAPYVWRGRIRDKIIPILRDVGSMMKYYRNLNMDDFMLEDMQAYIRELERLSARSLSRAAEGGYCPIPVPQDVLDRTPGFSTEEIQYLKGVKVLSQKDKPVWKFRVKRKVKDLFIDAIILLKFYEGYDYDLQPYVWRDAQVIIKEVNTLADEVLQRAKAEGRQAKHATIRLNK